VSNIESMDPKSAHEAIQADGKCAFLDVRTTEEYEQGHPKGAVNVPWAVVDTRSGQMAPNADFLPTVQKLYGTDDRLFLSCQAGMRSLRACQDLEGAGFSNLVNVDGGFGGRRDPSGEVITPGWVDSELPVENTPSTYGELTA
jgi:rhodanese-related sulfurtransferase